MKKMGMRSWYKGKNLKTFFFSMLLAGGVFMASCENDEDDLPQPAPTGSASIQSTNDNSTGSPSFNNQDTTDFPSTKAGQVFNGMSGFNDIDSSGIADSITYGTNGPTGY